MALEVPDPRLTFNFEFDPTSNFVGTTRTAKQLAAPGRMLALRRPMRPVCACARRRATGLVGDWRSIAPLLSQVPGAGNAAVVIWSLTIPTAMTSRVA